jgi:hypothetical protein
MISQWLNYPTTFYRLCMDISSLYHTVIEKSHDEDQTRIIETLKELIEQGETNIKLINFYQGLPLAFPATLVSVEHGLLDIDLHGQQAIAVSQDRFTFIRCEAFAHDIGAHVKYINPRKQAATLDRFFFAEIMAERRNAIRLSLDPPPEVTVTVQNEEFRGKVLNISMGGVAIQLDSRPAAEDGFEIAFRFMLPNLVRNTSDAVQLTGQHVGTLERDQGCILKISFTPDKRNDQLISQYLFQRQVEIIRELKAASI